MPETVNRAFNLSVVTFQEGEWWCAQCLQYDITAQAKTLPDLHYELERVIFSHLCVSAELGREPFEGLQAAPDKFWTMFEKSGIELELKDFPFRPANPTPMPHVIAKVRVGELVSAD
jgi:hypothetical protein